MNQRNKLIKEMAKNRNYPERSGRIPENQTVERSAIMGRYPMERWQLRTGGINYLKSKTKCLTKAFTTPHQMKQNQRGKKSNRQKADAADDWQNEQEVTDED